MDWKGFGLLIAGVVGGIAAAAALGKRREKNETLSVKVWGQEPGRSKILCEDRVKRRGKQWVGEWASVERVQSKKRGA